MAADADNSSVTQRIDLDRLQKLLRTRAFGRTVQYRSSTASTNADALASLQNLTAQAVPHGMVFLAEQQTAGRGRRGRTWHSPAEGNIYFSVIAVPRAETMRVGPWLSWVPLCAALATADSLTAVTGRAVDVKWPNDLLIGTKKLGGILCEQTTLPDRTLAIVIGIGLNVNADVGRFPSDLQTTAISLAAELGRPLDPVSLLAELFLYLEQRLERLFQEGPAGMVGEFTRRCSTIGKVVRVNLEAQGVVEGLAESIGPDGCLCLRISSGNSPDNPPLLEVRSAEVVHLRK